MTAFRLLKVLSLISDVDMNSFVSRWKHELMPSLLSLVLTVWDSTVSELQRSPAEEVEPLALLCACGEDLLSDITSVHPHPNAPTQAKPIQIDPLIS